MTARSSATTCTSTTSPTLTLPALSGDAENEVFNLKGPEPITIRRIAEMIRGLLGVPFTVEFGALSPGDYEGRVISDDKAKRLLGVGSDNVIPRGPSPLRRLVHPDDSARGPFGARLPADSEPHPRR